MLIILVLEQGEAHTPQLESRSHSQLAKSLRSNEDSAQPKINKIIERKNKLTENRSGQMLTGVQDSHANITSKCSVKVTWHSVSHAERISVSSFFRYKNSMRMRD